MWLGFLSTKAGTDLEFQVADESVNLVARSIALQDIYRNQFRSLLLFLTSLNRWHLLWHQLQPDKGTTIYVYLDGTSMRI